LHQTNKYAIEKLLLDAAKIFGFLHKRMLCICNKEDKFVSTDPKAWVKIPKARRNVTDLAIFPLIQWLQYVTKLFAKQLYKESRQL
jgi:hypothetical protein